MEIIFKILFINNNVFSVLDVVKDVEESEIKTDEYTVKWKAADGNLDGYVVDCVCREDDDLTCVNKSSPLIVKGQTLSYVCGSLTEGTSYQTYVTTVRADWDNVTADNGNIVQTSINNYICQPS